MGSSKVGAFIRLGGVIEALSGQNVGMTGSGTPVASLLRERLIDSQTFSTGVVHLPYTAAPVD